MQPGKGLGGTRESISRCGDADIFSHIQYPQRKTALLQVDTMGEDEASQEARLLKQMLNLDTNKPLGVLFKGGKFIFKALLFPARLFLFRMPRWVIVKLSPKISLINKKLNESTENLSKFVQNIAAKLKVLASLSERLKPFSALLKASFNKLAENFLSPFKKLDAFTKEKFKVVSDLIGKAFGLVESSFQKMSELLKKSLTQAKKQERHYTKSFDFKKPLQKAYSRLKTPFTKLQKGINEQLKKTGELLRSANKAIAKRTKPIVDAAKNQLERVTNTCSRVKNKGVEFVAPKIEAVQQLMQKALEVCKPPILAVFAHLQGMNEKAIQLFLRNPMLQKFKSQYASLKRMTVKMQKAQTALLKSFQRLGNDAKNACKKWTNKVAAKVKKQADNQKKRIIWLVEKGLTLIKAVTIYLMRVLKKNTRFFILFFKWCRIMVKFTVYLIREIIREARKA